MFRTFYQHFNQILAKFAPPIAREGAFFSVFRDLHDFRIFPENYENVAEILLFSQKFPEFSENFSKITKFSINFDDFSNIFQEKSVNSCRS